MLRLTSWAQDFVYFLYPCLFPTLRKYGWIFMCFGWCIGYDTTNNWLDSLTPDRLFHGPQTRRSGGLSSGSVSCNIIVIYLLIRPVMSKRLFKNNFQHIGLRFDIHYFESLVQDCSNLGASAILTTHWLELRYRVHRNVTEIVTNKNLWHVTKGAINE